VHFSVQLKVTNALNILTTPRKIGNQATLSFHTMPKETLPWRDLIMIQKKQRNLDYGAAINLILVKWKSIFFLNFYNRCSLIARNASVD